MRRAQLDNEVQDIMVIPTLDRRKALKALQKTLRELLPFLGFTDLTGGRR